MSHEIVTLDVREDIRRGGAPCVRIMESAERLEEGDTLRVIAPFEPVPLYAALAREGFVHESRAIGGGDWEVQFLKTTRKLSVSLDGAMAAGRGCATSESHEGQVVELDVRGLEPPQPMVRVLEIIDALPRNASLRAYTDRRPVHLLDELATRGFSATTEENPDGGHTTLIRRHHAV